MSNRTRSSANSASDSAILDSALAWHAIGASPFPAKADGSKAPVAKWQQYQEKALSEDQLRKLFSDRRLGVGIITGFGGLECLEFETFAAWDGYWRRSDDAGLRDLLMRVVAGYMERSPSGGVHLIYRTPEPGGNTKLAEDADGKTIIETRGAGGFVIVAPSNGRVHLSGKPYVRRSGSPSEVAELSGGDRADLLSLARTFSLKPVPKPRAPRAAGGGNRPGDDYNDVTDWPEILEGAGWTRAGTDGVETYWTRPGKRYGISATTNYQGSGLLYVFSTNAAPFEHERSYDQFGAYAVLNHGGDHEEAAGALAAEGYGDGTNGTNGTDPGEPVTLAAIPGYPLGALSGPLRDLVKSSVLPQALTGGAGLGTLAGLCGNAELVLPGGQRQRPGIWVALIAPPDGGKSPAIDRATATLRDLESQVSIPYRSDLREWKSTPAKDRGPRPYDPTLITDDATIEAVARWLDRGDGTAFVLKDELQTWLRSMGRYQKTGGGGEAERWLELWTGAPWRYQRVGGDIDIMITRPVATVLGGLQPKYQNLLGDEQSGFRPRWLPHVTLTEGAPEWDTSPQPQSWRKLITKLHGKRDMSRAWTLDDKASRIWDDAGKRWKRQARGIETESVSMALGKADLQCCRIAIVLAESLEPAEGGEIRPGVMRSAIALMDYVIGCWRAMPDHRTMAFSRRDETLKEKCRDLLVWLETHGRKATQSELLQAKIAGGKTADVQAVLAEFEATYPGTVIKERIGNRGPMTTVVRAPDRA